MRTVNLNNKSLKICAFCKYWYDPTNSCISPKSPIGLWEYNGEIQNKCLLTNFYKYGWMGCTKYTGKIKGGE